MTFILRGAPPALWGDTSFKLAARGTDSRCHRHMLHKSFGCWVNILILEWAGPARALKCSKVLALPRSKNKALTLPSQNNESTQKQELRSCFALVPTETSDCDNIHLICDMERSCGSPFGNQNNIEEALIEITFYLLPE